MPEEWVLTLVVLVLLTYPEKLVLDVQEKNTSNDNNSNPTWSCNQMTTVRFSCQDGSEQNCQSENGSFFLPPSPVSMSTISPSYQNSQKCNFHNPSSSIVCEYTYMLENKQQV